MSSTGEIGNSFVGNSTLPQDIACLDCERTFRLITALQVLRMRQAGGRCPTCAFNHAMEATMGFVRRPIPK